MTETPEPDVNEIAARVAREAAARGEQPLPADVEQVWARWIVGVRHVDDRTKALLRAAFELGAAAAQ